MSNHQTRNGPWRTAALLLLSLVISLAIGLLAMSVALIINESNDTACPAPEFVQAQAPDLQEMATSASRPDPIRVDHSEGVEALRTQLSQRSAEVDRQQATILKLEEEIEKLRMTPGLPHVARIWIGPPDINIQFHAMLLFREWKSFKESNEFLTEDFNDGVRSRLDSAQQNIKELREAVGSVADMLYQRGYYAEFETDSNMAKHHILMARGLVGAFPGGSGVTIENVEALNQALESAVYHLSWVEADLNAR